MASDNDLLLAMLEKIEKKVDKIDNDIRAVTLKLNDHDHRLNTVEKFQNAVVVEKKEWDLSLKAAIISYLTLAVAIVGLWVAYKSIPKDQEPLMASPIENLN